MMLMMSQNKTKVGLKDVDNNVKFINFYVRIRLR